MVYTQFKSHQYYSNDWNYLKKILEPDTTDNKIKYIPSFTTSAWNSSVLHLILNHFLTSDFDQESFIKHKAGVSSEYNFLAKISSSNFPLCVCVWIHILIIKFNNKKPCFSWNFHLSLFQYWSFYMQFLYYPSSPSPKVLDFSQTQLYFFQENDPITSKSNHFFKWSSKS